MFLNLATWGFFLKNFCNIKRKDSSNVHLELHQPLNISPGTIWSWICRWISGQILAQKLGKVRSKLNLNLKELYSSALVYVSFRAYFHYGLKNTSSLSPASRIGSRSIDKCNWPRLSSWMYTTYYVSEILCNKCKTIVVALERVLGG